MKQSISKDQVEQILASEELKSVFSDKEKFLKLKQIIYDTVMPGDNAFYSSIKSLFNINSLQLGAQKGLRIAFLLIISYFLWKIVSYFLLKIFGVNIKKPRTLIDTFSPILRSFIKWVFLVILSLTILSEIGVDIVPILLSFSVLGLAISIASQALIKDFINGFLSIFEGNLNVSDCVTINTHKGIVESLSLRCLHLRHFSGELEIIPFSEVSSIINHSRDYYVAKIEMTLSHKSNFDEVKELFEETFNEFKKSQHLEDDLIFSGATSIDSFGIKFVCYFKTIVDPTKQLEHDFRNLLLKKIQLNKDWLVYKTPET